ncbi:DUF4270 domain-containing protein [Nonlabens antarcticus]|uniref:DUF4270 domain-containing protein n=1 Tax=Nonlabens antarcticus TaxID=392714 RepID=UPI001891E138|nr:DUF4270 domain-containing protein [Nonlabens antarcticus]
MKNLLKYGTMVMAIVFVLISCDTDPNELGGDFLGIDIDGTISEQDFDVKAFSAPVNAVQTNNFRSVQLGTYSDPLYGKTTYDFVSQLSLSRTGINFSENPEFKSVILSIPYYSRPQGVVSEKTTYVLDSVYGDQSIDIQIFRNKYFLNSFDINDVEQSAAYYSDLGEVINTSKGAAIEFLTGTPGNETSSSTLKNFIPSPLEIEINQTVDGVTSVRERLSPRLRLNLAPDFWKSLLVGADGMLNFSSDSDFQNAFRGLYFKVVGARGDGNFAHLNLNGASITINYVSKFIDVNDTDGDGDITEEIEVDSSFDLNITGNRAVLLDQNIPANVQNDIDDSFDPVNGSSKLYLKGGPGAMTFIDLFGPDNDNDGEADALTDLISKNVLINEANIEFYVDQSVVPGGDSEPERILIYDYVTRSLLADFDISPNGASSNFNHLGRLERNSSTGKGEKYKIKLTGHITQIINGDLDNNRLALVVSQNVGILGFSKVKNQTLPLEIKEIPVSAGISHEGTVLHGNLSNNPAKRLKLKIFYTETN